MANLTIYVAPADRKILKQAKRAAKERGHSISGIAMGAIREYYVVSTLEAAPREAIDVARKAKKGVK